jgi:carbon-monoxide dehydrogenase small subunit
MLMSAKHLLDRNPAPTEHDVRKALQGNICRCTGYVNIVEAVLEASKGVTR